MKTPRLTALVQALQVLPGVGPKSAQRMALHLLQHQRTAAIDLAGALTAAVAGVQNCGSCNTLAEAAICELCADKSRDQATLCVVESPADLLAMEHTKSYRGRYFVLAGRLSPLDGIGPRDIALAALQACCQQLRPSEIIVATSFTAEGEATAVAIDQVLAPLNVTITRLARGLPVGSELESADAGALAQALFDRR